MSAPWCSPSPRQGWQDLSAARLCQGLLGPELLAVLQDSACSYLASLLVDSRVHHLVIQGQRLQLLIGQLPLSHPPQQRLQTAGQDTGQQIWACPSAWGGHHTNSICPCFVLPAAASSMPASHKASWCRISRSAQQQSVLCPASASSQGNKRSAIWGSAWGTACKQSASLHRHQSCHQG